MDDYPGLKNPSFWYIKCVITSTADQTLRQESIKIRFMEV